VSFEGGFFFFVSAQRFLGPRRPFFLVRLRPGVFAHALPPPHHPNKPHQPPQQPKNRFAIREERDYVTQDDFMRAVRKLCDAKKLESTLNYDSAFGDGGQK
jgi:hypothetical protein